MSVSASVCYQHGAISDEERPECLQTCIISPSVSWSQGRFPPSPEHSHSPSPVSYPSREHFVRAFLLLSVEVNRWDAAVLGEVMWEIEMHSLMTNHIL